MLVLGSWLEQTMAIAGLFTVLSFGSAFFLAVIDKKFPPPKKLGDEPSTIDEIQESDKKSIASSNSSLSVKTVAVEETSY